MTAESYFTTKNCALAARTSKSIVKSATTLTPTRAAATTMKAATAVAIVATVSPATTPTST